MDVPNKLSHVVKRTGAVVPFNRDRITNAIYRAAVAVGGRDRSTAERLTDQVIDILHAKIPPWRHPEVEEIQDVVEKVLIENAHARVAKAYILYRDERARARREKAGRGYRETSNIPWRKIYEELRWALDHELYSVDKLNERIERGEFADIVRESERNYEEEIDTAAQLIDDRRDSIRLVLIAGPSSSGKTTTTIKLGQRLAGIGLSLVTLNVDNYFYDLELHPRDEFGDYDFETPQALDLELIRDHLARLIAGEEVRIPFYDFKTGRRTEGVTPMRVGTNEVILIDSLHGLYAGMTGQVPDEQKFALFIEPLLQMKGPGGRMVRWTDLRLMRRMVRDAVFRSYEPQRTLEHWHYVRSSEMRNIVPYANTTDYIVATGLAYELPVMRRRLLDHFGRWVEEYRGDPLRADAFERAERVYTLLSAVAPVPAKAEEAIPPTSLLREFIGGSEYKY
ncbi:MAG TPA: ATP cone domain-containing protein [Anaerolineae bacterium]|nr:ATP cone domain-containing protein [Anaerolineae bacterium]